MNLRLRLPLCVILGFHLVAVAVAAPPALKMKLRHAIIRAPESRVITAALENPNDNALGTILWGWVQDGTATIVSDVSALADEAKRFEVSSGHEFEWVMENDHDFENARLIPTTTDTVLIGTSVQGTLKSDVHAKRPIFLFDLSSTFSPRNELGVDWPVWWPAVKAPVVNWYSQKDFFEEQIKTSGFCYAGETAILGITRRADQFAPEPPRDGTLDVIVAQVSPLDKVVDKHPNRTEQAAHDPLGPPGPWDPVNSFGRCTILGFGIDDHEAAALISDAEPGRGKELLDRLMKMQKSGSAKLRTFTAHSLRTGHRSTFSTARNHSYPTEMLTFPSAWEMRPIGTRLEMDAVDRSADLTFEHHPALPRRGVWRCALDSPDLAMWMPQFFVRKIQTCVDFSGDGVVLLGAMRTPDCNEGGQGLQTGETLVVMAKLDGLVPPNEVTPDPQAPKPPPNVQLEAIVFDVPLTEEPAWIEPSIIEDHDKAFRDLLARVKDKSARLAAHAVVHGRHDVQTTLHAIEEQIAVREVDPPEADTPGRYRPTGVEALPIGTNWEVVPTVGPPQHGGSLREVQLVHKLEHDVASLQQPDYRAVIAIARQKGNPPAPLRFQETWEGTVSLKTGMYRCIGARRPPGEMFKDRLHVAFLRARLIGRR